MHSPQFECFKHIIFLKSAFLQIITFLICLLNNSFPYSRTTLFSRHFVSNQSVIRILQNWTNTVVPGDSLLSSFPGHSSVCSCSTHSYTGAALVQSKREHNSWDDLYCMILSAQCVRLAKAKRDRNWDTILEVLCQPTSAPPSHRAQYTEERFLQSYMKKRQGIEDDFLSSCQNTAKFPAQRPHSESLILVLVML